MPAKNIIKQYKINSYYHIYNRGVERRIIFSDSQDCTVFLHYLKMYLSPLAELKKEQKKGFRKDKLIKQNLSNEINLLAFALMPNHFHLIIQQLTLDGIIKFMRRLSTAYVMYFNQRNKRVGALFQSAYKAVSIEKDEYLLHLSRYIHLNPEKNNSLKNYIDFTSYPYYLGNKNASWIKPAFITNYFKSNRIQNNSNLNSYKNFVEDYKFNSEEYLQNLIIEED